MDDEKGSYVYKCFEKTINSYSLSDTFKIIGQPSYFKVICVSNKNAFDITKSLYKFFFEKNILFKGIISLSLSHQQKDIEQILDCFEKYCQQFNLNKL